MMKWDYSPENRMTGLESELSERASRLAVPCTIRRGCLKSCVLVNEEQRQSDNR
jgi:hypothetical protein